NCDTLAIIGLSAHPEDIVFAVNRGQTQGAVGNFTMFHFSGNSLETKNLTFGNYCNVDLIYPGNPQLNKGKRKDAIVQAQIGICEGTDRLFADNCRFISRLNLCPFVGARRSLYDNCYFECTDDALSGSAVYLDCQFTFFSSKPFYSTAETGAVFLNCDITCLGSGVQYFTKVPGQVTVLDTRFHCENPIEIKWTRDASDIICRQENITLNGMPYMVDSERSELGPNFENNQLRNAYVVDYNGRKVYNIPNLLNGNDGWDPKGMNASLAQIESETGRKLRGIPVGLRLESDAAGALKDGDRVEVKATPLLWGGYPVGSAQTINCVAENNKPEERSMIVPVSTHEGLSGKLTLKIQPTLKAAPKFKRKPVIKFDESTRQFQVDYSLTGKGEDESTIMWGRIVNYDYKPNILIESEYKANNGNRFSAKAGDFGHGIIAIVFPKYKDTHFGGWEASEPYLITESYQVESIPESNLSTDFSDVSIQRREHAIPGVWSFDVFKPADTANVDWQSTDGAGWYYGKGFDASVGEGIVQNEKGARMSYTPARDVCKNMTVSLIAEPAKSGGQGFGSATSQYMDICLKFDPINLNGYALRIERLPDHDRAVSFSLIKYEKGKTSKISDEVISDCFRTPCHISVSINDGILQASAYTEAENAKKCCNLVKDSVQLSVTVEDSPLTGFCIQHTGSTGPSSTLIREVNLKWE
ncbi:MAG: hypothetical protein K2N35_16050, partial [Muribaculaceae bacterium]|nr:hypothetical protein [Muribaculaceae bacterium]